MAHGMTDTAHFEDVTAQEAVAQAAGTGAQGDVMPLGGLVFPGPVAEAFYHDDADVAGIQGPVGSGKTTTLLYSRLRRARMMPRSAKDGVRRYKLLGIRETYRQLWSTTIPSYWSVIPKGLGQWSGGRGDPVTHVVQFEDEFGPIELRTEFMAFGDNIEMSMRGVQTTDIWMNEADTMPLEVLTNGIGRIDRWPDRQHFEGYPPEHRSYGQIACDLNAPDQDNWTYGFFHDPVQRARILEGLNSAAKEGAKPIRISFHNQPGARDAGAENLMNLAPSYYPRAIAAMTLAGRSDTVARMIDNQVTWTRAGVPVFQREFSARIHVAPETLTPDPDLPLRIGLDQGFIGAAVIAQFRPPFHWRVLAELMFPKERLMARVFGQRLAELLDSPRFAACQVEAAWGDMAGEHGASQAADENATWNLLVGRTAGFPIRPQRIGSNRLQPRLEAVRAALDHLDGGEPGLLIDPGCRFLTAGFAARYVWAEEINATGDRRKVPDKHFTEANVMDALQYLLLSEARGDGSSPLSFGRSRSADRPGAPRPPGGIRTGWDVTDPYGGRMA